MTLGSAAASAVENDRAGRSLEGLRILVVEDAFAVAELIDGMLTTLRCEVVGPVGRLDSAIRMAREERLDGAVLDVNLGGRDVAPVADELEARGVPFFFATGYEGLADLPAKYHDRPSLKKPFAVRDFSELVVKVFA
jgi:CheY-like chemotaxis protein